MSEPRTLARGREPSPRRRLPAIAWYAAAVSLGGAGLLSIAIAHDGFAWVRHEPIKLAVLVAATLLAELKPMRVPHGNEVEDVTVSSTFAYALAIGWGGLAGGLALAAGAVGGGLITRRPAWKILFNAAQYAVSMLAAGAVLRLLGDLSPDGSWHLQPDDLLPVLAGGIVFFLANNTLVATAIALAQRAPLLRTNVDDFLFQAATGGGLVALAPVVIVLLDWSPAVFPILLLPMVAIYEGGRAAMERVRNEDRYRALAQHAADLVAIVDVDGRIAYVSPSVRAILGHRPEDLIGGSAFDIISPDDTPRAGAILADLLAGAGKEVTAEFTVRHVDGTFRHVEATCSNLLDNQSVRGIVVNARDITERKLLEEELAHQAFHDPLTNLANRALFRDRVEHALARSARSAAPMAVLFVDLDDFKTVNDSLGHAAGDEVLSEVAGRIRSCLRPGDTAARLGGDEFALLLEDTDADSAARVAGRIIEILSGPFSVQRKHVVVRASIGIAVAEQGVETAEEVLRNADAAMYSAKGLGKGRFERFEPGMQAAALDRLEMEGELQRAVTQNDLFLRYQPVVSLATGHMVGVEALVRWRHPRRGLLPPSAFIPLAEDTGLVVSLGRLVLEQACAQAAEWAAAGDRLSMSVNISAKQLQRVDFVEDVSGVLARTGLDPGLLVLEITESTLMRDAEESVRRLKDLKRLGVRIAIDDFGTGYSSLSYLKRFPVDVLKIDKSFVDGLARGGEESAIARAIVQIGRSLQVATVAEGIERADQLMRLRGIGCEYGQGFHVARPVAGQEISTILSESRLPAAAPRAAAAGSRRP